MYLQKCKVSFNVNDYKFKPLLNLFRAKDKNLFPDNGFKIYVDPEEQEIEVTDPEDETAAVPRSPRSVLHQEDFRPARGRNGLKR